MGETMSDNLPPIPEGFRLVTPPQPQREAQPKLPPIPEGFRLVGQPIITDTTVTTSEREKPRMERAGQWLKDAYATAGKSNEGPYKFSDPLGGGEPYVPSAAELKAKPPVAKARVAEPTPDLDAQVRKQLPKAPLVGPRTNAPMPVARPTSIEYGIKGRPSEEVIVNPLSGAGASETGKVKGQINPDTGEEMPYQPTQAEIDRAQAAGKPVVQMLEGDAKEDLPFRTAGAGIGNPEYAGRTAAERDIERRAEARQS